MPSTGLNDFLFIDESGDPGPRGSTYYACAVLHVTAQNIKHLYSAVAAYRFIMDDYDELKSYRIPHTKLCRLNRLLKKKSRYFKCSAVYLSKQNYTGPYLHTRSGYRSNPTLFRKYMYRQVLNLHFQKFSLSSRHVELVMDRSSLNPTHINNLESYLNRYGNIPVSLHSLTSVDSRYVDLIQLADLVCAQYKPDSTGAIGRLQGLSYSFINAKDITLANALGETY